MKADNTNDDIFAKKVRLYIIIIATISVIASVVTIVWGRKLTPPSPTHRDSFSAHALGHRAFYEFLGAMNLHTTRFQRGYPQNVSSPLFIIEPQSSLVRINGRVFDLKKVIQERLASGYKTILVFPKWQYYISGMAVAEREEVLSDLLEVIGPDIFLQLETSDQKIPPVIRQAQSSIVHQINIQIPYLQTFKFKQNSLTMNSFHPLLTLDDQPIVLAHQTQNLFIISDSDLVHNFNIHRANHGLFWHRFMTMVLHTDTVVIDETFHGHEYRPSISETLGKWPGILILIHLVLLSLCFLWYGHFQKKIIQNPKVVHTRGVQESIDMASTVLALGQPLYRLSASYIEHLIRDLHRRLMLGDEPNVKVCASRIDEIAYQRGIKPDATQCFFDVHADTKTSKQNLQNFYRISHRMLHFRHQMLEHFTNPKTKELS